MRIKKYFKYQTLLVLLFAALFIFLENSQAAECVDIVISELQITGGTGKTNEDFIELLNAGNQSCDLKDHRLVKRTENGTSDNTVYEWKEEVVVLPWGYYLWANSTGLADKINADAVSDELISSDNGIAVRYKNENSDKIVDALGWGSSKNIYSQRYLFTKNPGASQSLERKTDKTFFLQTKPNPKNSENIFNEDEEEFPVVEEKYLCKEISLNDLYPFGDKEYVEVKNNEDRICNLTDWKIEDAAGHRIKFLSGKEIKSGEYLLLEGDLFLNNDDDEEVRLLDVNNEEIDKREYAVDFSSQDKSYSYFDDEWKWTKSLTPGKKNEIKEENEDSEDENDEVARIDYPSDYADTIFINEFLPTPIKGEDEFIELYNASEKQEDLFGWILHDATKSGQYIFKEHLLLNAKEFLVIVGDIFKFALNSNKETLTLRDAEGKIVSQIYYDKSKSGASYNWNGSKWRWSKFLTPGKANIFNNEPYGKLKLPKDVWEDVYADFSISTGDKDGEKVKVAWDFGDGRKSYLTKTRHKYKKEGKYQASVKLSDGSEDVVESFIVKVEKFPHPEVKIVAFNANPVGSDTQNETIAIENKSKKKINLVGWSIATGASSKKLVNYPIREDFEIGKKKIKEITREFSSFTLNNKKGKIELRYPDGEVASKVKYEKEEGIAEGEIYKKVEGGWEWVREISNEKLKISNESEEDQSNESDLSLVTEQPETREKSSVISNQSSDQAEKEIEKYENKFIVLGNDEIKMELLKLDPYFPSGAEVREEDGKYILTAEGKPEQHYAIVFLDELSSDANVKINELLSYFQE